MKIEGSAKLLRIYIGANDKLGSTPLYEAIINKAEILGLAGTTVIRGVQGFGASHRIHRARILRLAENLPLLIEIVDTENKIMAAVSEFEQMIEEAGKGMLMTLESIEILRYKEGKKNG